MSEPIAQASAAGKAILFGEHAVVYGRPAIAVPVSQVRAVATITPAPLGSGCILEMPDVGGQAAPTDDPTGHPLAYVAWLALSVLDALPPPDWRITLRSTIPVASGLGSGAAAATAIVRAVAQALGRSLPPAQVSALVYESEKRFHGTPSGVDNTVIAFEQPVWFVRGQPPQPFVIGRPFTLVIADTGVASPTRITVGDVRRGWEADPPRYEALFDAIGGIVHAARRAIEAGDVAALGPLMDENQRLLQALDVSSPELERLCAAARSAGALGAKLSGGGRGGNMIALVTPDGAADVTAALEAAGARSTLITAVGV
ncbi:MAG: mevalonate kinase [Caldilineales bacterium]|nr:mevalonate kinase [Caldilineales bacterium]MDW8316313.1 mevalonate kinase [Anaerolineae bacterium]